MGDDNSSIFNSSQAFVSSVGRNFLRGFTNLVTPTWSAREVCDEKRKRAVRHPPDDVADERDPLNLMSVEERESFLEELERYTQQVQETETITSTVVADSTRKYHFGFSFSPAGLLLPYHLGVASYLVHRGLLTEHTPLAGASAGALCAVIVALGLDIHKVFKVLYSLEENLRSKGTIHRLRNQVKYQLECVLPENCHETLNARPAPCTVIFTTVYPFRGKHEVSQYTSKSDVIACLLASCNIPGYFSRFPLVKVRDVWAMDGYFSDPRNFGCPPMPDVNNQIRVLPFPSGTLLGHLASELCIAPDLHAHDNDISPAEYQKFMQFLRDTPAPAPPSAPFMDTTTTDMPAGPSDGQTFPASPMHIPFQQASPPRFPQIRGDLDHLHTPSIEEDGHSSPCHGRPSTTDDCSIGQEIEPMWTPATVFNSLFRPAPSPDTKQFNSPFSRNTHPSDSSDDNTSEESKHAGWLGWTNIWDNIISRFIPVDEILQEASLKEDDPIVEAPTMSPTLLTSYGTLLNANSRARNAIREQEEQLETRSSCPDLPVKTYTWRKLLKFALHPVKEERLVAEMYDLGRADGFRWTQHWLSRRNTFGRRYPAAYAPY